MSEVYKSVTVGINEVYKRVTVGMNEVYEGVTVGINEVGLKRVTVNPGLLMKPTINKEK